MVEEEMEITPWNHSRKKVAMGLWLHTIGEMPIVDRNGWFGYE